MLEIYSKWDHKCLDLKSGHKIRQFLEVHLRYVSTYRLNFPGDAKTLGLVIESCGCGEGGYKRLYDRHFKSSFVVK